MLLGLALLAVASCSPIPIENIDWVDDGGGFIRFKTNDPERADQRFVKLYPTATAMPLEVTMKKVLGTVGGGYGIVFHALNDKIYWKVLISVTGMYKIARVSGGSDVTPYVWTDSPQLIRDYNKENRIKITYASPIFTLWINDVYQTEFFDEGLTGGPSVFYAYVGTVSDEYLPAGQVDVRFKMTSPEAHP